MHIILNILAGLGFIFLVVTVLRWLFSSSRGQRLSQHDKAATFFYFLFHDDDGDGN